MIHFIYQTKNLISGKTYLGVHSTDDVEDGYLGCGCYKHHIKNKKTNSPLVRALLKHGVDNFVMMPMEFFDTAQEAYDEEKILVNEDWISKNDNYNATIGGKGGSSKSEWTEERRRKVSENRVYGPPHNATPVTINGVDYNSLSDASRKTGISIWKVTQMSKK